MNQIDFFTADTSSFNYFNIFQRQKDKLFESEE